MARTQAADYDRRRDAIMRAAAAIYAERGFLGTSMAQIAAGCGASKSLIYHYYPSKEDILFDVMDSHVQGLTMAARAIVASPGPPAGKVRAIAGALMERYADAKANHKVLLNELGNLPFERRQTIVRHQRELLDVFDGLVGELRPDLRADAARRRVLTMLFFGMLNWTHTWLDPEGPIPGADVAQTAAAMFLAGAAPEGGNESNR